MDRTGFLAILVLLSLTPTGRCLASTANISINTTSNATFDATSESRTGGTILTIELNKQYVPVKRDSKVVMYKAAYYGDVFVGLPVQQQFTVVFDTGSGHFFIPSMGCKDETCEKHARYKRNESESAVDLTHGGVAVPAGTPEEDRDQVNIQYGTGEITGDFSRDIVCLTDHRHMVEKAKESAECLQLRVITAREMTDDPFIEFAFDGVAGLGLESLALQPEFSFFGAMAKRNALAASRFGVFISRSDAIPSEISFGGHDERRIIEPIHWAPVAHPEAGYWQVIIRRVFIGDKPLEICEPGDCVGILDTGSSLIGVPSKESQDINWKLAREVEDEEVTALDCRQFPGPQIIFDLGNYNVTMGPEDYSRPAAMKVVDSKTNTSKGVICRASLLPVDLGDMLSPKSFVFGEPVLRKYYSVYDWEESRAGFALAAEGKPKPGGPTHKILGAPPEVVGLTPSVVMV